MISRDRLVGGILFAGGLSIAAYGAWSAASLVGALASGRAAVDAGSAVFGVPPLGLCLAGFGLIMLVPGAARPGKGPALPAMFGGTLLMGAVAVALLAAGPWMVDGLMRARGYRPCDQRLGVRTAFGRWAADAAACEAATNGLARRSGS